MEAVWLISFHHLKLVIALLAYQELRYERQEFDTLSRKQTMSKTY